MAQIEQRLSAKVQKDTGMCEVLIRFFQGSKFNLRAKSGVFVSPEYFEYYIDRAKTESLGVKRRKGEKEPLCTPTKWHHRY